ncbi:hypothetical protein B6D87_21290 [Pseudomonas fragi]|uniref:type II secretion system protein GspM n=1 Tax=Pseudomonas fragi TaxID=296 RepID=UPI000A2A0802|nr:type II secretion system protein GspM [Pseudomonas fragi]ARQ76582.1 hypothetical protein B6D87_21290 [Pseudomonas fragi]NNB53310.1 type II secretion system protein M [Pseudomonas fragi]
MKVGLRERWSQLPSRDRQLCRVLAVFLLVVFSIYGFWLPAQQRLDAARGLYFKQMALAAEIQQARPGSVTRVSDQPLASRLSESAISSGLTVEQFELDAGVVRITLNGDAAALLGWLNRIELEGSGFESLSLEKRDSSLQARLQIHNPS